MENLAAHNLLNLTLKTGWTVKEKIERKANHTGATFSVGYLVEKDGEICFLKAFDFGSFLSMAQPKNGDEEIDVMDVVNDMTTAFRYERDLSRHCRDNHVTKVSFVRESGQQTVLGYSITIVPYLIFDLADGDVRTRLEFSEKLDYSWRFKSLRDIAVGLKQLHKIEVSHQDLKPSNVLVYKTESKLGDLGRSICLAIDGPYNKKAFTGDWTYAPPEMMYGYYEKEWLKRVCATDCYLLGSLIVFYFIGISMSALLRKHIPDNFSWERWRGPFADIQTYLENAFQIALIEFGENIKKQEYKQELTQIVKYLCHPFPEKRGHPKAIAINGSNYDFERVISQLDLLRRKAEINVNS
jgi:serine/threonine protein kinase